LIAPDSSVLIPALASSYEGHERCLTALAGRSPRLIAHVAFETTSVLSRVPKGLRMTPVAVREALDQDFPGPWLALDADAQRVCLDRAVHAGLSGGALYDALIAATAREHRVTLLSADRRARTAYEAMGVDVRCRVACDPVDHAACGAVELKIENAAPSSDQDRPTARRSGRSRRA
jgi:predicted nucleic acid-binding protein